MSKMLTAFVDGGSAILLVLLVLVNLKFGYGSGAALIMDSVFVFIFINFFSSRIANLNLHHGHHKIKTHS